MKYDSAVKGIAQMKEDVKRVHSMVYMKRWRDGKNSTLNFSSGFWEIR